MSSKQANKSNNNNKEKKIFYTFSLLICLAEKKNYL